MSKYTKLTPVFIFLIFAASTAMGQSITPNSGTIFEETNDVPIDGAILLLTAAGAGLGIKRLYARKK